MSFNHKGLGKAFQSGQSAAKSKSQTRTSPKNDVNTIQATKGYRGPSGEVVGSGTSTAPHDTAPREKEAASSPIDSVLGEFGMEKKPLLLLAGGFVVFYLLWKMA
jgi:hypothetical protein